MRADEISLKRHSHTCRGIATYIAHPLIVPTQEAYWYLPWDCYLYRTPNPCATQEVYWYLPCDIEIPLKRHTDTCPGISRSHSRGILILAVGLLPYRAATHCAHSRSILMFAVGLLLTLHDHSLCPLKRHTDSCRGIAAHIARPLVAPTQEAYWYLPQYCYWSFLQAHSTPHSSGTSVSCVDFLSNFHSCSHCYLFGP